MCAAAPALRRDDEFNMQQLILISCPLGSTGGFWNPQGEGKSNRRSGDLGQVVDGLNSVALAFFSFPELVYNFAGLRWEIKSKHSQFGRKAAVPQKTGAPAHWFIAGAGAEEGAARSLLCRT